jgi:trimethylamine--corrinoid protein Co-methyltransferase
VKTGLPGGFLNYLGEGDLERINKSALALLDNPGVFSDSDLILDLFQRGGGRVDRSARTIRLPATLVDSALRSAPSSFVVHGREPEMDLLLEPGRVYFGMGGTSEPFFWDYETGRPRTPTVADMVKTTRVGQALPKVDFIMALCSAGDKPRDVAFFHEYDAIFRNTTKPVVVSSLGQRSVARFLEMAIAATGGEDEFRRRPWVIVYVTPISPLQVTRLNEGMIEAARYGCPIQYSPAPLLGATGPVHLRGELIQATAEALFGLVMSQLIKPGTPFIYAPHTPAMDMRTTQVTYASAEQAVGRAAVAQFGRFYNLPTFNTGAGVESKLPDAAAAAEAMMGMLLNALAGMTLTQCMGTLASGLYGSVEMLLICDEMARMVERVTQGVPGGDDAELVEMIRQVGHHGSYLEHDFTVKHFRQQLYFPMLFERQTINRWLEAGARPIVDVAHERVQEILRGAGPVQLPSGADEALERALRHGLEEFRAQGWEQ